MEETQSLRLIGKIDIEEITFHHVDGQNIVYWEDIEQVFPGVKHLKNGNVTVSMMRDSVGIRMEPFRIKHCPGTVLDVVVEIPDTETDGNRVRRTRAAPQDRGVSSVSAPIEPRDRCPQVHSESPCISPLNSVEPRDRSPQVDSESSFYSVELRDRCPQVHSESSFNSAESQDRSPQSTPQNNGSSNIHNPEEALSNQGSEGPSTAMAHLMGDGDSQNYHEALRCLLQAANQGHSNAQYKLGEMYENGEVVDQDASEAAKWYEKAGSQGNTNAQRKLGIMFKHAHGVPEDYTEARKWFKKAADQGDVYSQVELGFMKKNGQGGPRELGRALEHFGKAIGQGLVKGLRF
ncbi:hypothetical protein BGZ54_001549 [Gamsiella multidivaricata]|nr:hypothetical protein BGZ54_001549 [Gamsiella multidivaricata]